MTTLFKNANVYTTAGFEKKDVFVSNGRIFLSSTDKVDAIYNCDGLVLLPGFTDVHVHLREPGFSYKETIKSGTMAAARGGFTTVCSMPNLKPAPSNLENLQKQLEIIQKDAVINVLPYGTITSNQDGRSSLSDMEAMKDLVCAFSDDGKGLQTGKLMKEAMLKAKSLGKMIVAHSEDESLLFNGYIHDGEYAKAHGHRGICSESEWGQVKRDIELIKEVGSSHHVCHISCKETVELIRQAKKEGIDITCETGPHYLILSDEDLKEEGRFKMNPPIRSKADREALIEGIKDGTIEILATDHAPHSEEEKAKGLEKSYFGVVGIETSFPLMYTYLVKPGIISFDKLMEIMVLNPNKRFHIEGGEIKDGEIANFTLIDLNKEYVIDPKDFISMGKSTPFEGFKVFGEIQKTVYKGEIVYEKM